MFEIHWVKALTKPHTGIVGISDSLVWFKSVGGQLNDLERTKVRSLLIFQHENGHCDGDNSNKHKPPFRYCMGLGKRTHWKSCDVWTLKQKLTLWVYLHEAVVNVTVNLICYRLLSIFPSQFLKKVADLKWRQEVMESRHDMLSVIKSCVYNVTGIQCKESGVASKNFKQIFVSRLALSKSVSGYLSMYLSVYLPHNAGRRHIRRRIRFIPGLDTASSDNCLW